MEQPEITPTSEPSSATSAEPAAAMASVVPVVDAEIIEDVSASDISKQGTDDGLHAAAELEKLAGVTGLRSALGDVQQGIGDLKAQVASSDSLIKEMEAKLAQARRQKEEAGAAP